MRLGLFFKLFVFSFLAFLDGNFFAKKKLAFVFDSHPTKEREQLVKENKRAPASQNAEEKIVWNTGPHSASKTHK